MSDTPDRVVPIEPGHCTGCTRSLTGAAATVAERRQVVDLPPVPGPVITEYQLLSKTCSCCGTVTTADWTAADDVNVEVVAPAGSPVRIGPRALAMCALLTCGHYLPRGAGHRPAGDVDRAAPVVTISRLEHELAKLMVEYGPKWGFEVPPGVDGMAGATAYQVKSSQRADSKPAPDGADYEATVHALIKAAKWSRP